MESEEESVLFGPNSKFTTQKITTVNEQIIYLINLGDCPRYVSLNASIEYLGLVHNDKFHVFKLTDGEISEEFQSQFAHFDDAKIKGLSFKVIPDNWEEIRREVSRFFTNIPNFLYISYRDRALECVGFRILDTAKQIIHDLNADLHRTCPEFTLNIDYIFNLPEPSFATSFSLRNTKPTPIFANTLLLCLFNENKCVSSLEIEIKQEGIVISSKTDKVYEGRKFNKLLRAVIIIIAKAIDPESRYVESYAITYTSAYLMLHYLNAVHVIEGKERKFDKNTTFDEIKTAFERRTHSSITTEVELNDENIQNAVAVFIETIGRVNCGPLIATAKGLKTRRHSKKHKKHSKKQKYKLYFNIP